MKKTINDSELNPIAMSVNKELPTTVIDDGKVQKYVGIGWVEKGRATEADYEKYPVVVRDDNE